MSTTIDLTGKRALVSGVTSGIGAGIARALAHAGCDVAGCGRTAADEASAQAFLKDVLDAGRKAHYTPCDLTQNEAIGQWVNAAAAALGGVDIVVSNAGRNVFAGLAECTDADWQDCIDLNLAAHWRLAKAARPFLLQSARPLIIIITSNHAWQTLPGCFPYNVCKAGLVALVQSLAIEWGPKIRAVGVAPGFTDTPGNDTWFNSHPNPAEVRAQVEKMHPVGRIATTEEIGRLCAFLGSDLQGFINGTTLLMDGGVGAIMKQAA